MKNTQAARDNTAIGYFALRNNLQDYNVAVGTNSGPLAGAAPLVEFKNITLGLGSYINEFIKPIVNEIEVNLRHETDFRLEARNEMLFRRAFRGWPKVMVPEVYEALCTQSVMVQELSSLQAPSDMSVRVVTSWVSTVDFRPDWNCSTGKRVK